MTPARVVAAWLFLLAVAAVAVALPTLSGAAPPVVNVRDATPLAASVGTSGARRLTQAQINLTRRMARARWGPSRCAAGINYRYSLLAPRVLGEAHWWFYVDQPRRYRGCEIVFAVDPRKVATRFPYFCAAELHEFGHLAGHGHSRRPSSVMYPILGRGNVPAACWRAGRSL